MNGLQSNSPTAEDAPIRGLLTISRGTAILLLIVYVAYLVFQVSTSLCSISPLSSGYSGVSASQLKTHRSFFLDPNESREPETQKMSAVAAGTSFVNRFNGMAEF